MTAASLVWFLVRVIPNPARAAYPCQQAAFPVLSAFVIWLVSLKASFVAWFGSRRDKFVRQIRFAFIGIALAMLLLAILWASVAFAQWLNAWSPSEPANSPMGVARGIHPGRVVWVHDPTVTTYSSGNYYYLDAYTSVSVASSMLSKTIQKLTSETNDANAWNALFTFYNQNHERGSVGYSAGEKIAIKINCNNYSSTTGATHDNKIDATPQMVKAVLRQLVNTVGVAQADITVYDSQRYITWVSNYCCAEFPSVRFRDKGTTTWVTGAITFATNAVASASRDLPDWVVNANYLINLAVLKRHCEVVDPSVWVEGNGQTAITCCMKNNFGTSGSPSGMHTMIRDWRNGMGSYNALVDLNGSKYLEGKTVLYLIDGLFSGTKHNSNVYKWNMAPFNGNFPCSLFGSQDLVAIDSVALDFLNNEMGLMPNADNFLHEAAQANNPPSGFHYRPDGANLVSLGVHEHWNSATSKQYSRNLSTSGTGIELVPIHAAPGITVSITSPANGASLNALSNITLTASAVSGYTGIQRVEFYRGATLIGTSSNAPFSLIWSNAAGGSAALSAIAYDADNFSAASAVVNVTISTNPVSIGITSPATGAVLEEGSNIPLQVSVTPSGAVTNVTYFRNGSAIGNSANSPFDFVWSNAPAGYFNLTATATDTNGAFVPSSAANILVKAPRIALAGTLYVDLRATNFSSASGIWTNLGTLGNFARVGSPTLTTNADGIPAIQFNGTSDLFIGPVTVSDLDGSSDRSVEVWVFNPAPLVNEEAMVAWSRRGGPNSYNFAMNYGTNLQYGCASQWGSSYDVGWTSAANIPTAGIWHHIVYTYDGATTCKVYVDGALRITKTLGGVLNSYAGFPILIGASTNTTASPPYVYYFGGYIGTVRVHGGVLNASSITNNFSVGPYVANRPLILSLQSLTGTTAGFGFNTVPGHAYRVEYSDSLSPTNWLPLGSFQTATGSWLNVNDSSLNQTQRFYRATSTP